MDSISSWVNAVAVDLTQRGREAITLYFFPPHYCRFARVLQEKYRNILFIFCPSTNGADARLPHNLADDAMFRLARMIQDRSVESARALSLFALGHYTFIEQNASALYSAGLLLVYWYGGRTNRFKMRAYETLQGFYKRLREITDLCIVSGDGDFVRLAKSMQMIGINVIVAAEICSFTSLALIKQANEFLAFPPSV